MKTKKNRPLSISAYKKYLSCPRLYDLHYNKRLRPKWEGSSLLFGSAMDEALNALLSGQKLSRAKTIFHGLMYSEPGDIEWAYNDYDPNLLCENSDPTVRKALNRLRFFGFKKISDRDHAIMNAACGASLKLKGELMLDKFNDKVLPLIEEVKYVQKQIKYKDKNGKEITGYIDFIGKIKGHGWCIIDNKTSSRPYAEDKIEYDSQLALYSQAEGIDKVAFIVFHKEIEHNKTKECVSCEAEIVSQHKTCPEQVDDKRCGGKIKVDTTPEAKIQLIVDKVPQKNKDMVIDNMTQVNEMIERKYFPMNYESCDFMYGKQCPYKDYCYKGKKDKLFTKEEE